MYNDIVAKHRERMLNLRKYYPFFKLTEVSFTQFKDGKYDCLDMGYIVMGVLRFFIEENSFKEKEVTYPEYLEFIEAMLKRDFGLKLLADEYKEIADYIFDKIKNDGKAFEFNYYDPVDRKKRVSRVRVIESTIRNNTVWYRISSEAIEFYLDTKEIKDESRISVQQLLLEKMIKTQNFTGGTEVIARINEEVDRLQLKKNEVVAAVATDVFAGIEAYEDFVNTGMKWFEDEEKLFKKNSDLITATLEKMQADTTGSESYYRTTAQIYELENQLKVAMNRHSELLKSCTELQKLTDDAVRRAKLGRLRSHVDFAGMLHDMIKGDNADIMVSMLSPLLKPKINKTFTLGQIDDALTIKPEKYSVVEKVSDSEAKEIVFEDEIEDERIRYNYIFLTKNLLQALRQRESFTLEEFNAALKKTYSEAVLKNADYFSYIVNLCQKSEYTIGGVVNDRESFLDDILQEAFRDSEPVSFVIQLNTGRLLEISEECQIADVIFKRK